MDSDQLLQLIFDHAGEGICVFDAQFRLQAFNARFVELSCLPAPLVVLGARLEDLLRAQVQAGVFGPVDVESTVRQQMAGMLSLPMSVHEQVRPDGSTVELRRSRTPGGGFMTMSTDITQRKAAQAALADEQRMLQLLIQSTEQGIWFIDNDLRTTNANPAMCRMLGWALDAMLGRSIYDFVDEANADIFRQRVRLRREGVAESYEIALLHARGHLVHCYNNATPIFDAQGLKVGAVGMFSDITPLQQAQQQVRLTSELLAQKSRVLERTLDSLSQGVCSFDTQGRSNAYNRRFLELLEIPQAVMRDRPSLPDLRRYQIENHLLEGDQNSPDVVRRVQSPLYQRKRHDGLLLEVQTHTATDGSLVRTYTDVTAAVTAQQALQESEARFRSMADAAPAFIWQADAKGSPAWFNQRWLAATGRDLNDELQQVWATRMHEQDLERCRLVFFAAVQQRSAYEVEYRVLTTHGGDLWLVDHGIPRFAADGRFEGFNIYGWDITERKAAQVAALAAKEEAERANRAKSEFLSRMSHELRTPLNAVLGFAQLLEVDRDDPLSAAQRSRVQELQRGGLHLLGLINDVLDVARIEAGTLHLVLVPVELGGLARECMNLVQSFCNEQGTQLHTSSQGTCWVLADPMRLRQVMLNLLSNAIKYNRPGGQVTLSWRADGDQVRIAVRDTGPGLSDAQQEKLFRAFERLQAEKTGVEGTGIGLALSKWLVDLMQGTIGVDSAPGDGSEFWFTLHSAQAPTPAAHAPDVTPAEAVPARAGVLHDVLYIEDNEVNQILMQGMLSQRPQVKLRLASMPLEGLAQAIRQHPDLVLLDIQLPGMDGFEVLQRLRQHEADQGLTPTPVVAVSANAMPEDRSRAAEAGFADYITKPIDLPVLLAMVDRMLRD
jgi:PAS domain S-box-containing protein